MMCVDVLHRLKTLPMLHPTWCQSLGLSDASMTLKPGTFMRAKGLEIR